jgi:hypothetical protein
MDRQVVTTKTLFDAPVVVGQPVATRAELSAMWYEQPDYYPLERVEVPGDVVAVLVARQIRAPLKECEPVEQCGRFVRVRYTPRAAPDPETIVFIAGRAAWFNRAMRAFRAWADEYYVGCGGWYDKAERCAREVLPALMELAPTRDEAAFVCRFLALSCAHAR